MSIIKIPKNMEDRIHSLCALVRSAKNCSSLKEHDNALLDAAERMLQVAEKATEKQCTTHIAHSLIVLCLDVFETEGNVSAALLRDLQVEKIREYFKDSEHFKDN